MFIYIIQCKTPDKPFKIGVSKNPYNRIKDLQTACPYELELVSKVYFKGLRKAYAIEKQAHKIFKDCKMRGEWFKGASVSNVITYLERKGGIPSTGLTIDERLDIAYLQSIQGVYV